MAVSSRGFLVALMGFSLSLLGAGPGGTPHVVDVRVGLHDDVTRVVIELDARSGHRIERRDGRDGDALAVRLDASAERRRIASRSPLVEAVTIEPGDGGAVARIALREPGLDYSELLLDAPPRIVIDVRRPALAARRSPPAVAAAQPAAKPAPAKDALVEVHEEAALSEPAPAAPQPAAAEALPAGEQSPAVPPASYRALVLAQQTPPVAQDPAARQAEPPPPVATPPPLEAVPTPAPVAEELAGEPPAAGIPAAPAAATDPLRSSLRAIDPAPALLGLAGLAAAGIVWRRIAKRRTRERALEETEEAIEVFGDAVQAESEVEENAAPPLLALAVPPAEASDLPVEAPEDRPLQTWQPVAIPVAEPAIAAAPFAVQPEPPFEPLDAEAGPLEDRLARLEERIEELLEARARLERFAAAQNEELRVQRAAIARTQRMLREISRPGDAGAEPGLQPAPIPPGD